MLLLAVLVYFENYANNYASLCKLSSCRNYAFSFYFCNYVTKANYAAVLFFWENGWNLCYCWRFMPNIMLAQSSPIRSLIACWSTLRIITPTSCTVGIECSILVDPGAVNRDVHSWLKLSPHSTPQALGEPHWHAWQSLDLWMKRRIILRFCEAAHLPLR